MTKQKITSKEIAILGCGWLGIPLAEHLLTIGYHIRGSATSIDKKNILDSKKITSYIINVTEDGVIGDMSFFDSVDILIITIPPKVRSNPNRRFDLVIKHCRNACIEYKIKEVLFISSTSVYGSKSRVITEESKLFPETNSGKQLAVSEKILFDEKSFSVTILRMGGLIGQKRHPIFQLIKKEHIVNPKGSINLIHLTDCILIISRLLKQPIVKNVYNCVTPYHPTREKYYTEIAITLSYKQPVFIALRESNRYISSEKLIHSLGYEFQVKNLLILS